MIPWLLDWLSLHEFVRVPAAFDYVTSRMILALITSLVFCIAVGKPMIERLRRLKLGQQIRGEEFGKIAELHSKKANTPTMGGLLILASLILSLLLWMDLFHPFTWILCGTTLFLGAIGALDDWLKIRGGNSKGLSPRYKFAAQALLACILSVYLFYPLTENSSQPIVKRFEKNSPTEQVHQLKRAEYAGLVYFPFFKRPILELSGWGALLMALGIFLMISGFSNAVNLTDGLDGLATGCMIPVAACLALVAFLSNHMHIARYLDILYIEGGGEIAIYMSALIGACLGFLWFNSYPSELFMGDVGSLALGGIIGVSAILLKREGFFLLIGGIFVAEALSVILQVASYRWRNQKRIFLCAPLHHHFEYQGIPETKIVMRFWIASLLLAFIGLISLKFQ